MLRNQPFQINTSVDERFLYLDTRNSETEYNFDTNWQILQAQSQLPGNHRIALIQAFFPNSVYPINEFNQILTWVEFVDATTTTTSHSVIIPENNYNITQFAAELQAAMNSVSVFGAAAYTVGYDSQSSKLNFEVNGTSLAADYFYFTENDQSLIAEMGVTVDTSGKSVQVSGAGTEIYIPESPVHLSGTQFVDIISNLGNNSFTSISSSQILARVPVAVGFGDEVFYEPSKPELQNVTSSTFNEIQLQLRDDNGNFYKLPKNAHFCMTLKIISES